MHTCLLETTIGIPDDWAESVEYIKEQYDSLVTFFELKDYVDEKIVFDKGAKKPESVEAKKLFEAVKT